MIQPSLRLSKSFVPLTDLLRQSPTFEYRPNQENSYSFVDVTAFQFRSRSLRLKINTAQAKSAGEIASACSILNRMVKNSLAKLLDNCYFKVNIVDLLKGNIPK